MSSELEQQLAKIDDELEAWGFITTPSSLQLLASYRELLRHIPDDVVGNAGITGCSCGWEYDWANDGPLWIVHRDAAALAALKGDVS